MIVGARKKRPEMPAIVADTTYRNAGERRAMITAFAADQPEARSLFNLVKITARNLQRSIDRLRSRIDEKHVLQVRWRQFRESGCDFKRIRMSELEGRSVIERAGGPADCIRNFCARVAGVHAPQARAGVEKRAPALVVEIHSFRSGKHPGAAAKGSIGGER